MKQVIYEAFASILEKVKDKELKNKEIEKIFNHLGEGNSATRVSAGEALFQISRGIAREDLVRSVFEKNLRISLILL